MPNYELIANRKILATAIDDLTSLAREQGGPDRSVGHLLLEVARMTWRLRDLQREIEKHDLD